MSVPTPARISDGGAPSPWAWTPGTYRPRSIFMPTPEQERLLVEINAMLRQSAVAFLLDDFSRLDRAIWQQITELRPPEREIEPPPEWATPSPWKRWKP